MQKLCPTALGVYLSIPFCRAKCSYCNFASGVFGGDRLVRYVDRLVADIRSARQQAAAWQTVLPDCIDTLYFGGGTPSLLIPEQLQKILNVLHEQFDFAAKSEITLECAPGQLSDALLEALPALGVHRISFGVQSFVDTEAAAVGRLHTCAQTLADIARLRRVGIENINVDLLAGLPHQTETSWQASLDQAIATQVPHISVYMLEVDEDSRLGRELLAGGPRYHARAVPDDAQIAAMYQTACERLAAAGIAQYEISNFACSGWQSRHNEKYWLRQPYFGFGMDAHSMLHGNDGHPRRVAATDDLATFLEQGAQSQITIVDPNAVLEEAWFLGLRRNAGVSLLAMEAEFGAEAIAAYRPVLASCVDDGLLQVQHQSACLTAHGRLFSNEVFERFLGVTEVEKAGSAQPTSELQGAFA
ncbi:MAG TPA: radical SAM family heme chaperone HemW [Acidobacteriaceae bacterium]|jgi:oxygen-independent coproporphyrinogen-3 oxidase|nr:radical SAM family heme chaperone HemW [Acidobacteriaceae bacterium]